MFTVKTILKPSNIEGIGVFADEFIPKGKKIHFFVPGFDIIYSDEKFNKLPENAKSFLLRYAYYNKNEGGYVLCGDNGRYVNHSDDSNMKMVNDEYSIATRDINIGEEITDNYYDFDDQANIKLNSIK